MPIASAREMVAAASARGYAVGAFNVTGLPQMQAVVEAAVERRAPLIIQTSVAPSRSIGPDLIVAMYRCLAQAAPVPICLHLDHCTDAGWCGRCADAGYTNVMIDASREELQENIRQTNEVCAHAHAVGDVTVEGELGTVGGVEDQLAVVEDASRLCDPEAAVQFVQGTGVDLLAPAIGTAHGIYATSDPKVDFDRLRQIRKALDARGLATPLVIHGGTGLPDHTVRRLIELGGAKFNVSTELKHVLIDTTRRCIEEHPAEYDPGRIDRAVKEAIKAAVTGWMDLLGCSGKA
jgi:tagatose 1,6-diphosphate aldolase GatY/KbaY